MILKKNYTSKIQLLLLSFTLITLTLKENINSIALGLLFIYSLFCFIKDKKIISLYFFSPFLILFSALLLNLILFTPLEQEDMWKYLLRFLPFLIIPLSFSTIKISPKNIYYTQLIYVMWIGVNAVYSHIIILNRLFSNGENLNIIFRKDYSYMELSHTIGLDSTYYAYFALLAIIISFQALIKINKKINKVLYVILIAYLSFFIIHLSSRMMIVALIGVILYYVFHYFFLRKKIILGIICTLIACIFIFTVLYNVRATRYRFQQITGFTFSNGTTHQDGLKKLKQFNASIDANNNFLFGNGVSNANTSIIQSYLFHDLNHFAEKKYNAHNQYIQTYVGAGIIGVIILIFMFAYFLYLFIKYRNLNGFLFTLFSSFLFLTESYLERHNGIVLFTLFICMHINYSIILSKSMNSNTITPKLKEEKGQKN